jgi:hypothetical protein
MLVANSTMLVRKTSSKPHVSGGLEAPQDLDDAVDVVLGSSHLSWQDTGDDESDFGCFEADNGEVVELGRWSEKDSHD